MSYIFIFHIKRLIRILLTAYSRKPWLKSLKMFILKNVWSPITRSTKTGWLEGRLIQRPIDVVANLGSCHLSALPSSRCVGFIVHSPFSGPRLVPAFLSTIEVTSGKRVFSVLCFRCVEKEAVPVVHQQTSSPVLLAPAASHPPLNQSVAKEMESCLPAASPQATWLGRMSLETAICISTWT